jgi:membrane protein YdbS with pleckstrin-like domain
VSTNSHSDEEKLASNQNPGSQESLPEESAASKFRQEIASKQAGLEDYDPEEQLWSGGYSPKAMIGTWVVLGVLSVVLLALPAFISGMTIVHALGAIVVMWVIAVIRYASRRLGVHYQLTTQRFIHQTGILTRQTDRIEVIDIDDVSFTQGPVQRAFGVGTIRLTGSDRTHPTLAMQGIASVKEVAGLIDDIRRKERRRRSLHIEQI